MALRQRKSKKNVSLCNKEIGNHPSVSVTTQSNLPNSRSRRCTQRISDNSAIEDASTSVSMSVEHSVQDITASGTSQLRRSKRRRVLQKDTPTVTNSSQASYQRSREDMALRQRKSKRNLSLCNKKIANHPSVSVTTRSNLPNSRSRRCTQRISDNSAIEDASTSISNAYK